MTKALFKKSLIAFLIIAILGLAATGCKSKDESKDDDKDNQTNVSDVVVDKSKLDAELALEVKEQGDYTAESYNAYKAKLAEAKAVAGNADATQEAVDGAVKALSEARAALAVRPIVEVEGAVKSFRLISGDSKEITISDYVNTNGLSKITYDVKASNSCATVSDIADGKFTVVADEINGSAEVKVFIYVSYDGVKKLTVELNVRITNDLSPTLRGDTWVLNVDLYDLTDKESFDIDFAGNVDNAGNLALTYSAKMGEESLTLDGSCYTLTLGSYDDELVYTTFTVTVSYEANGEAGELQYTLSLGIKDTSAYRVANGNFDNGLNGWTSTTTEGDAAFGAVTNNSTFWGEGYAMNNVGNYFSAYAEGAEEISKGYLASSYFTVKSEYATYMLGGCKPGNHNVYVAIENRAGEVLAIYRNTRFTDFPAGEFSVEEKRSMIGNTVFLANFVTYKVSLAEFAGQEIRFVVYDNASSDWGVVFFDELNTYYTAEDVIPENAILAENLMANKDALSAAIAGAVAEQGDFTEDSYNAYAAKVNEAKALVNDVDYGFDLYAPQTFTGKPIAIGWLNMWDRNVPSEKYGFAGMLTVPRAVSVKDGRLYQEPIVNCTEVYKTAVNEKLVDNVKRGVITIKVTNLESLDIKLRSNGENFTRLTLNNGEWVFDRSKSGEAIVGVEKDADSLSGIRRMPCSDKQEITLTIVMDDFSVEIFEDGRSLTSTIYPPDGAEGLELTVEAESCQYERADVILK